MKKAEFEQAVLNRAVRKEKKRKELNVKKAKAEIVETMDQELEGEMDSERKDEDYRGASEADRTQPADIKLGEIQLRPDSVLLVKKTNYKGDDRVDFRIWKNTDTYKGPTKQGFVVSMEKLDEFFDIVDGMKKKLRG